MTNSMQKYVACSGRNTRVGYHFLLQGIFPTQALNPGLLHCRQILYHLSQMRVKKWEKKNLVKVAVWKEGKQYFGQ